MLTNAPLIILLEHIYYFSFQQMVKRTLYLMRESKFHFIALVMISWYDLNGLNCIRSDFPSFSASTWHIRNVDAVVKYRLCYLSGGVINLSSLIAAEIMCMAV